MLIIQDVLIAMLPLKLTVPYRNHALITKNTLLVRHKCNDFLIIEAY